MTVLYNEGYADFFDAIEAMRCAMVRIESESMPRPLYDDGTPVRCTDRVEWLGKTVRVHSIEWCGDRTEAPHWAVWFYDRELDADVPVPWHDGMEPLRRYTR